MTSRIDRLLYPWQVRYADGEFILLPYIDNDGFELAKVYEFTVARKWRSIVYNNPHDNDYICIKVERLDCNTFEEAKAFAEQELAKDGWEIMSDKILLLV